MFRLVHYYGDRKFKNYDKLEIRSMERGICPIAVFYFPLKRSFFNI